MKTIKQIAEEWMHDTQLVKDQNDSRKKAVGWIDRLTTYLDSKYELVEKECDYSEGGNKACTAWHKCKPLDSLQDHDCHASPEDGCAGCEHQL